MSNFELVAKCSCLLPHSQQAAHNLSIFRSQVLSRTVHQFTSPKLFDQAKKLARFNTFPLTVTCPPGREVKLLGTGEGVKYACDISELETPCLIYSFGSEVGALARGFPVPQVDTSGAPDPASYPYQWHDGADTRGWDVCICCKQCELDSHLKDLPTHQKTVRDI